MKYPTPTYKPDPTVASGQAIIVNCVAGTAVLHHPDDDEATIDAAVEAVFAACAARFGAQELSDAIHTSAERDTAA